MLSRLHRIAHTVSSLMVQLNGIALLVVAFFIACDVIFRKFFNLTVAGSDEIAGYVLLVSSAWAYSYCLLNRSHIRIDVVYALCPFRLRCLFDLVGLLAMLIFIVVLTRHALGVLLETIERGAVSNTPLLTPLWIPQVLWVAGLAFFSLSLVLLLVYATVSLIVGDFQQVARIAGVPTIREEIETETRDVL